MKEPGKCLTKEEYKQKLIDRYRSKSEMNYDSWFTPPSVDENDPVVRAAVEKIFGRRL